MEYCQKIALRFKKKKKYLKQRKNTIKGIETIKKICKVSKIYLVYPRFKCILFVLSITKTFKKRQMTTLVHSFVATPLRHVCAREETVTKYNRSTDPLPRVFRSFGPSQGLASIMRARARPIFPGKSSSARTHARTGNRPPCAFTHRLIVFLSSAGYFWKGPLS